MKITFIWWTLWSGRKKRVIEIPITKAGYPYKEPFYELLSALKGFKGKVEVEE